MADDLDTAAHLQQLIAGIDPDHLELPAFPDVVTRLQALLADESVSMRDVAALIQSDPVLTAKLLRKSNHVAAIACVVARQLPEINADQAILAGLVHQIGTLWLMITVQRDHVDYAENLDYQDALDELGASAANAVLTTWRFPAAVREAVASQDALLNPPQGEVTPMATLLAAAKLRDRMETDPLLREQHPEVNEIIGGVMFGERSFVDIVAACRDEILDIQDALSTNLG